jgi:DNA polymerase-3 subunit epsilon
MSILSESIAFTAIDFETAQGQRNSICQVGLVRVVNGKIANEESILVQPPGNAYWGRFTQIHGIGPADTFRAQTFDKVWPRIEPYIAHQQVVAHNGFGFDFPVLAATLQYYGLNVPVYDKHCTYKIYRMNLASLCSAYRIALNHHDALSDARACALLFLKHLNSEK